MKTNEQEWPICLDARPTALFYGQSLHGHNPVEHYCLPGIWCVHFYTYHGELIIDGSAFPIEPGNVCIQPPGAVLEYRYFEPRCVHYAAHFTLPAAADTAIRIRAMQSLGDRFDGAYHDFAEGAASWVTNRRRAEARLWDVLWEIASEPGSSDHRPSGVRQSIQRALQDIDLRLAEPITVEALAREAGISQNHFTRCFKSVTGSTVVGYIRQRRVERAIHLLRYSGMPIKKIAEQVGIGDLHLFNKVIREAAGGSPRKVRAGTVNSPVAPSDFASSGTIL
jgi:AraC family transcriptional regulator